MKTSLGSRYKYSYPPCYFTCQIQTHVWTVYFSASKCFLKQLQRVDSKSVKLALGIPVHVSTFSSYREAGIVPLDEFRKLALATYFVRASSSVENFTNEELARLTIWLSESS